jgi:hypothetical protein
MRSKGQKRPHDQFFQVRMNVMYFATTIILSGKRTHCYLVRTTQTGLGLSGFRSPFRTNVQRCAQLKSS